ncbi:uncharacterized protein LOC124370232 [Homalodisca vitripennis]|uniref:uncharacterized protein LOC124370232 n=1 Tax=Homalodisca vitripennis TaxID=197043 RepID=UPI001EECB1C9|nr:uncharacterized protein LOC124370232 [Homalodisca vitripennis]
MSQFQVSSRDALPRDHPDFDPWVKVRDFIDNMNDAFKRNFVPSQEVCIDKSMVGMKNRCVFIQYMPNKRHSRFGIKKFELCDSASGYVLHSALYSGTDFLAGGQDPFTCRGLLNKRHHLFTDNYYTKIPLAQYLLDNKT